MALDPNIILSGRGVDVLGAMSSGNALATQTNALQQQNALTDLYRTQGAGIMAGDQNALNALAAIDPAAGLGFKGTTRDMAWAEEDRIAAKAEGKRAAEEAMRANADKMTAEQIEADKKAISEGLSGAAFFYQKGDQAGYNNFLTQQGMDPAQFDFADFPAHAAMFEGALEAMNGFAPPAGPEWRQATPEEAASYGASAGQLNTKTGEFKKSGDGNGITQTITNPDGTTTTFQVGGSGGGAGGGKSLTESQAKFAVFQTDMTQAAEVLNKLEKTYDPTNLQDAMAGVLGDKWGSFLQTGDGQIYKSAAMQWLDSGIRIRTGAAATDGEVARQYASMFPQPGDDPKTVAYKQRARENFQRSVDEALSGVRPPQAPDAPEDMFVPSGAGAGSATTGGVQWSIVE